MLGESAGTCRARLEVEKLANSRWPVLILGETGTGKEVAARSIHLLSGAPGPLVTIDCSCMGTLLESELFGHVRGAFTGAATSKVGLLEAASGGTAFFDEIGELPLEAQAKLLRVIQEKEFRPLGAVHARHSDFRIIAATNRDLVREVEAGTFRRDLYFRLNVLALRLIPLRERIEDIPVLLRHFLEDAGDRYALAPEAAEILLAYSWPGNVRELGNCIRQMVVMSPDPLLTVRDIPASIRESVARAAARPPEVVSSTLPTQPVSALPVPALSVPAPALTLMEWERLAIEKALAQCGGDRRAAAQLLGIGRTTLFRKLKEYRVAAT
ncbi:MAG TPA: sigma-54 dependent transcriptional regulator [Bryobacteraceae bacterium]|nr:sigma-54 dependent transcriptional regulator [Bryobacteraceae bacterium]